MADSNMTNPDAILMCDEQSDAALISLMERTGPSVAWRVQDQLSELSADQIGKLIRVFTRLEILAGGWGRGSTSQVPALLAELDRRDRALAYELRIWAFHTTNNPYIPFGSYGWARDRARSVAEYYRLTRERQAEVAKAEHLRSDQALQRKRKRAIEHSDRIAAQLRAKISRDNLIDVLARIADPAKRLEAIASDCEHPPYYYPEEFAKVDSGVLSLLEQEVLSSLAGKLSRAPKGAWRKVRSMLELAGA